MEGVEHETFNPFFWLCSILPSWISNTSGEFPIVVANKELAFVQSLSVTDKQGLFADTSHTLFKVGYLISMVVVGQDDVLDSSDLSREWDELREKCEVFERGNVEDEMNLIELPVKVVSIDSLWEKVDRYSLSSTLTAQVTRSKISLAEGEERWKKVSKEVIESCRAFKADRKVLCRKKDDQINALKDLEEEVVVARHRSQESLQQTMEALCKIQDQMLEQTREFCPSLSVTANQLNPFIRVLIHRIRGVKQNMDI